MAILINSLVINSASSEISVDVITTGSTITNLYAYIKYSNADIVDLSTLIDVSGIFTITAEDLGVTKISDILYLEFISDDTTGNTQLGLVANFLAYHECLLNKTLSVDIKGCDEVVYDGCPECEGNLMLTSIVLDSVYDSLNLGYYDEADDIVTALKDLCEVCSTCPDSSVLTAIDGYGFKTVGNAIIRT